jgi:hypothetical protein
MEYFLFIQKIHPFKITKRQNISVIKFRACSLSTKSLDNVIEGLAGYKMAKAARNKESVAGAV